MITDKRGRTTGKMPPEGIHAVRELLTDAFTPEGLDRFCQDNRYLHPSCTSFSPRDGLDELVGKLIDYTRTKALWHELLAAVAEENPNQYRLHESSLEESVPPAFLPFRKASATAAPALRPFSVGSPRGKYILLGIGGLVLLSAALLFVIWWRNGPGISADEHLHQGLAFYDARQFDQAITEFQAVLKGDPNNLAAYTYLGHAMMNTDRLGDAIDHYRAAVLLAPDDPERHADLGWALHSRSWMGDALDEFRTVIALDPSLEEGYSGLGSVYEALGDCDEASWAYSKAAIRVEEEFGAPTDDSSIYWRQADALSRCSGVTGLTPVVVAGAQVFLMDREQDQVYVGELDQTPYPLQAISLDRILLSKGDQVGTVPVGELVDMELLTPGNNTNRTGLIILETGGALLYYDPGTDQLSSVRLTPPPSVMFPKLIGEHTGRLYLLDSVAEKIWRYSPTSEGYTMEPDDWLQGDVGLTRAVDMVVGSSIYLLRKDRVIERLTQGVTDRPESSTWMTGLYQPTAAFVPSESDPEWIYVADRNCGCIVQYNSAGYVKEKYPSMAANPSARNVVLSQVTGLFVDPIMDQAYIANGPLLYVMNLGSSATEVVYRVEENDSVDTITAKFAVPEDIIGDANSHLDLHSLPIGSEVTIPLEWLLPYLPPSTHELELEVVGPELLGQEAVILTNTSDSSIDLSGWSISDEDGNQYKFSGGLRIWPGGSLTVNTRRGDGFVPPGNLYWHRQQPVWSVGETVTVRDSDDNVVAVEAITG